MKLVDTPEAASQPVGPVADDTTDQWQVLKETLSPPRTNALQLTADENIVHCPNCSKPVVDSVLDAHKAHCTVPVATKDAANARKPSLVITLSSSNTTGSNPASAATTTSSTKKKPAPDPERNCCVPLPSGQVCPRSLTCKTHSINAKRAVQRSQPYDVLLAAVQSLSAPKPSTTDTTASLAPKPSTKKRKRAFGEVSASSEDEVDSDAETDNVIEAIQRSGKPATLEMCYGAGSGYSNKSRWIGRNIKTERMRELLGGLFAAKS